MVVFINAFWLNINKKIGYLITFWFFDNESKLPDIIEPFVSILNSKRFELFVYLIFCIYPKYFIELFYWFAIIGLFYIFSLFFSYLEVETLNNYDNSKD